MKDEFHVLKYAAAEGVPQESPADVPVTYEFHIAGPIGPLVRAALPELTAHVVPAFTMLTGTTNDHDHLQALLAVLTAHGYTAHNIQASPTDVADQS
jgi:hypothetical protein